MAYSLYHNKQFIYYSEESEPQSRRRRFSVSANTTVHALLDDDRTRLSQDSKVVLETAGCFKKKDKQMIMNLFEDLFPDQHDAIGDIIAFFRIQFDMDNSGAAAAPTVTENSLMAKVEGKEPANASAANKPWTKGAIVGEMVANIENRCLEKPRSQDETYTCDGHRLAVQCGV